MKKKNVESVGMRNSRADTKARRVSRELTRSKTYKGTTAEKAGQELGTSPEREREGGGGFCNRKCEIEFCFNGCGLPFKSVFYTCIYF